VSIEFAYQLPTDLIPEVVQPGECTGVDRDAGALDPRRCGHVPTSEQGSWQVDTGQHDREQSSQR
jgi:hypothetical protein